MAQAHIALTNIQQKVSLNWVIAANHLSLDGIDSRMPGDRTNQVPKDSGMMATCWCMTKMCTVLINDVDELLIKISRCARKD